MPKGPVSEVVAISILILALALFMSPVLACLVTFAAAVAFLAVAGRCGGAFSGTFASLSLTLSLASVVTSVTAYLLGSSWLLLTSLLLGYASPAPLIPVAIRVLGCRGRSRAVAATLILSAGVLTLPLYGVAPLKAALSGPATVASLGSSGLYALIGYAPSSTAIIVGYLILIYVLVSGLRSFLQETSAQVPPPPQPP